MPPHGPPALPARPALPSAVSVLVAGLVDGPRARATILAAHRFALYLSVGDRVLPVVTSDAVALPTAVRLGVPSHEVPAWGVAPGDVVTVGDGRLSLPGFDVVAARTWRPARVRRPSGGVGCSRGRGSSHLGTQLEVGAGSGWLADGIRAACSPAPPPGDECGRGGQGDDLRTHGARDAVAELVGRGPGLTPSGDDALAGALLVAHALGTARHLAPSVRARLGATTAVSAALLGAAADGFAAHPVVALVDAAVAGDTDAVSRALPAVLAIGHTSGHDTVTGIRAALEALTTCRECGGGRQDSHFRTHDEMCTDDRSAA